MTTINQTKHGTFETSEGIVNFAYYSLNDESKSTKKTYISTSGMDILKKLYTFSQASQHAELNEKNPRWITIITSDPDQHPEYQIQWND